MEHQLMRLYLIVILLLLIPGHVTADTDQAEVLVIYGTDTDRDHITNMLEDLKVSITTIAIDELAPDDIDDQDQIFFASSIEFSTDDLVEIAIQEYLNETDHQFMVISPYIDEFSGELETQLGIDDFIDISGEDNTTLQWTITPNRDIGNYTTSDSFTYTGRAAMVSLEDTFDTLASFTDVIDEDEEEIELPRPAIWNGSQDASIYVIPTSLNSSSSSYPQLDQTTDFISTIVNDLIVSTVSSLPDVQGQGTQEGGDTSDTGSTNDTGGQNTGEDNTTDSENTGQSGILPTGPDVGFNLEFGLLAAFIAFLLLFYSKILSAIQWLIRKWYGVMIAVVGAFYNIQDRTLSHSEVMTNTSRTEILAYLDYIGSYGAHLREIKSVTGMGSGSLLWHLQVLEDYGMIDKFSVGSYTIFVADGNSFDFRLKQIELKLQSKYTLDLLEVLVNSQDNTITLSEIQEKTGIARRSLRRLVKKLSDEDLVEIEKYPQMTISITERQVLEELYQSFHLRDTYTFDKDDPQVEYME